eukprot:13407803-Ditylum_brightwellii.AAC.1
MVSWVKARQDGKTTLRDLPLDAQLNCTADHDASVFHKTAPPALQPTSCPPDLPLNHAYIIIN